MVLSCELSSSFLSPSERSALYAIKLNQKVGEGEAPIENGTFIEAGSTISAFVSKLSGAGEVAYFDFAIEGTTVGQRYAGPAARTLEAQTATTEPSASSTSQAAATADTTQGGPSASSDGSGAPSPAAGTSSTASAVSAAGTGATPVTAATSESPNPTGSVPSDSTAASESADPIYIESVSSAEGTTTSSSPTSEFAPGAAADSGSTLDGAVSEFFGEAGSDDAEGSDGTGSAGDDGVSSASTASATGGDESEPSAGGSDATATSSQDASSSTAATTASSGSTAATGSPSTSGWASLLSAVATSSPAVEEPVYRSIEAIEGSMPSIKLPDDLAPGAYRLTITLKSAEMKTLQKLSLVAFIGLPQLRIESVSFYPPSVEPGQALLLSVRLGDHVGDPWLRWSKDGASFAEGSLSKGFDRVVWTAPRVEGAYSLSVEAFPSAPPADGGFVFRAAARRELKPIVKATPGGSADEFSDPLAFYSLLRLDGGFDDIGVRSREVQPAAFGSPAIDVFAGGFGYRLGEESGIRIPGLMPPALQGASAPFSLVFRLAPGASTGRLARFAAANGEYNLDFGLEEGRPYASFRAAEGEESRSDAAVGIEDAELPRTIVVCVRPEAERSLVSWNVEGERIEAEDLPPLPAPPAGSALLGGAGSLAGVYDAFGLMSPAGPSRPLAPASYRLASRRKWKGSLTLAEGLRTARCPRRFPRAAASSSPPGRSGSRVMPPSVSPPRSGLTGPTR